MRAYGAGAFRPRVGPKAARAALSERKGSLLELQIASV
jgi:hypothetical protein